MVQRVGPKDNSTAPGHTVRFKPRMLSTPHAVSTCGPGLRIKQQGFGEPASGKEDRAVRHCLRAGQGRAVCCWLLSPKGRGKLFPIDRDPDPTPPGEWRWLRPVAFLSSRKGASQGQPPGSPVCPGTGPALLGYQAPRVAVASST